MFNFVFLALHIFERLLFSRCLNFGSLVFHSQSSYALKFNSILYTIYTSIACLFFKTFGRNLFRQLHENLSYRKWDFKFSRIILMVNVI